MVRFRVSLHDRRIASLVVLVLCCAVLCYSNRLGRFNPDSRRPGISLNIDQRVTSGGGSLRRTVGKSSPSRGGTSPARRRGTRIMSWFPRHLQYTVLVLMSAMQVYRLVHRRSISQGRLDEETPFLPKQTTWRQETPPFLHLFVLPLDPAASKYDAPSRARPPTASTAQLQGPQEPSPDTHAESHAELAAASLSVSRGRCAGVSRYLESVSECPLSCASRLLPKVAARFRKTQATVHFPSNKTTTARSRT